MQSVGSAFDRLGEQGDALTLIEENTRQTKESVAIGGDLYTRIDELTTAILDITDQVKAEVVAGGGIQATH